MALPAINLASSYRESIEDSLSENRLDEALSYLQDFVGNLAIDLKDPVLLLRRRYREFYDNKIRNLATPNEADLISQTILEIVSEAERRAMMPPRPPAAESVQGPSYGTVLPVTLELVSSNETSDTGDCQSLASKSPPRLEPVDAGPICNDNAHSTDEQLRTYWADYRRRRPPDETTAVRCDAVTKIFGKGKFSLETLSFSLCVGQITGIVGRNASGKTTLLRIVQSEILPDSGTVTYPALARDSESWTYIKRQISDVPQFPSRWNGQVKMNLHFAAAAHGIRGRRNRDLVEWHIERYGLSEYRRTSWKALSGGYRLRFELVKALVSNPRLLVLDEPLASLDIIARQDFLRDLRAIAYSVSCPIPILITSQHIYEIDAIADQVIVLDSGKCLFMGSLSEMEQQSTSRFFEVNTSLSRRLIQQRVRRIGMTIRNAMSDGYIIECSKDIHREHALASLTSTLGSDMLGIRDITGSSRRFFIDANQVEN